MLIEKKKISELKAADYNPRKSTITQDDNLSKSLEKFGVVEPIVFNKQTGNIVGGHFRIRELKKLKIKEVDCVIVDLNLEDEKELNIRLNANTGEWDFDKLESWDSELLEEWGVEIIDMEDFKRPDFEGAEPEKKDEKYFYIEFYEQGELYKKIKEAIGKNMETERRINPVFFTNLILKK